MHSRWQRSVRELRQWLSQECRELRSEAAASGVAAGAQAATAAQRIAELEGELEIYHQAAELLQGTCLEIERGT